MQFDRVVCPTPYPISAGDSIGHLEYFQVPKDGGYDSRYQVHIECLSADDSLPTFLTNPERAGESSPLYLKCPSGLPLLSKDLTTETMVSDGRVTRGEAILKLSQVKTEQDAEKQEYWFLPYRDVKNKMIVKHPSEWYHKKDTPVWQSFLNKLTSDAPEWREYCEAYLDKMVWMQDASKLKLGPTLWHMHPVAFLGALLSESKIITLEMLLASNLGQNKSQCETVLPYINKYAKTYGMIDCKEIAHFLSQIGHESGFSITEENLNYSAKGMRRVFGCIKGPSQYNKFTDDCNLGRLRNKLWSNESIMHTIPKILPTTYMQVVWVTIMNCLEMGTNIAVVV